MFKTLLIVLFVLILLAYVFSDPLSSAVLPRQSMELKNNIIKKTDLPILKKTQVTLEEDIVNNIKLPGEEINESPTYQPLLSNGPSGFNIE